MAVYGLKNQIYSSKLDLMGNSIWWPISLLNWKWTVTSLDVELTWQSRRGGGD